MTLAGIRRARGTAQTQARPLRLGGGERPCALRRGLPAGWMPGVDKANFPALLTGVSGHSTRVGLTQDLFAVGEDPRTRRYRALPCRVRRPAR